MLTYEIVAIKNFDLAKHTFITFNNKTPISTILLIYNIFFLSLLLRLFAEEW